MGWALGGPDPVSYCLVAFVIVIASLLPSYLLPLLSDRWLSSFDRSPSGDLAFATG